MPKKERTVDLSREQVEVICGIVLGDAHVELSPNGRSARLKIEQSAGKAPYVEHLHQFLSNLNPGPIVEATNSGNVKFSTGYFSTLKHFHTVFYGESGRRVPKWIGRCFTGRSLAYLIMDDGSPKSKESKGMNINLYGLPASDLQVLCGILERRLGLQAKVVRDRQYHRIFISGKSYERLVELIDPWVLPVFRYKIPSPRKPRRGGEGGG